MKDTKLYTDSIIKSMDYLLNTNMEFFFDDIRSQTLFSDEEVIRRIAEATANMAQEVLNSEEEDNHKDGTMLLRKARLLKILLIII
mmetsp:Transcript_34937/g.62809  ORF Transcript_34937/g.62809 Transcript_34937/m.62809 type:complete len:86 (+) Transcript_34937:180-437(+)